MITIIISPMSIIRTPFMPKRDGGNLASIGSPSGIDVLKKAGMQSMRQRLQPASLWNLVQTVLRCFSFSLNMEACMNETLAAYSAAYPRDCNKAGYENACVW